MSLKYSYIQIHSIFMGYMFRPHRIIFRQHIIQKSTALHTSSIVLSRYIIIINFGIIGCSFFLSSLLYCTVLNKTTEQVKTERCSCTCYANNVGMFFNPEDGGDMFLQNVSRFSWALYPKRQSFSLLDQVMPHNTS
jgi:hypothetical protein